MKSATTKRLLFLAAVGVVVIATDQWSKYLAVKHLTHTFGEQSDFQRFLSAKHPVARAPHVVVDDLWAFQYVENPGAAWGLLSGAAESIRAPFFLLVSIIACVLIINYYLKSEEHFRVRRWALALVFGGAVGNFLDRIRLGYVIDFIDWHYADKYHWPTFNIADAAISIGVVLLLLESYLERDPKAQKTSTEATAAKVAR